jgi:hypothetical protein
MIREAIATDGNAIKEVARNERRESVNDCEDGVLIIVTSL